MTVADQDQDVPSLGAAFAADPYPVYAALRARGPVVRVVYHGLPCWLVIGHGEARQLIDDRRLSLDAGNANQAARAVPWAAAAVGSNSAGLLSSDPPVHTRLRRLVSKAFTPRQVESLRPRVIEIAGELAGAFASQGWADLVGDFSAHLPAIVIMELLGVPAGRQEEFAANCDVFLTADPDKLPLLPAAIGGLRDYLDELVAAKRHSPQEDLLSQLVRVNDEGDQLSDTELRTMAFVLLLAGLETTASLIGNGMLALLLHPPQLARLRSDPALIGPAVEEMLRYAGPVVAVKIRHATEEIAVGGIVIGRGDPVVISVAAANHDPRRTPEPGTFDISRADQPQLAFGYGIHFCLGASLARLETAVAFTTLLRCCPDIKLACDPGDLSWRVSPVIHGLTRLPVTFTPQFGGPPFPRPARSL
jgi:hypothetical protein